MHVPLLLWCFYALMLSSGFVFSDQQSTHDDKWSGWKCDDLTPNLCALEVEEGDIPMRGGLVSVHYYRYRGKQVKPKEKDLKKRSFSLLPIIALHGGPGFPHDYILPLKQQACRGRDVVFYDQAGCGESSLPPSSDNKTANVTEDHPWLLDPWYYATEELPALISHLDIGRHHVIGHSWGTILAQLYAVDAKPSTLASMVLSGPLSDDQLYIHEQWDPKHGSLGTLPPYVQGRIHALEQEEAYDSFEYQAIDEALTGFFTVRTQPSPDCFVQSQVKLNREIYEGMQGASEFASAGILGDVNTTSHLHKIHVPVLLTSGKYDTMRPRVVNVMYKTLPRAEWVVFKRSGHVSMIDEPGPMNDVIADFFNRVETSWMMGTEFVPRMKENREKRQHSGSDGNDETTLLCSEDEDSENITQPCRMSSEELFYVMAMSFVVGLLVGACLMSRSRRHRYDPIDP